MVTRSSWPVTLLDPDAPGAPPYWLKYGRSLMALPVLVKSVQTTPKKIATRTSAKVPLPPANATTVMTAKLEGFAVHLCDVGYSVAGAVGAVLEQEELDRHVGVAVDLAHERAGPASGDGAHGVAELVAHRVLEG
jgi:hypothetical protein